LHDLLDGVFQGRESAVSVLLAWNGWLGLVGRGVYVAAEILVLSCYRRLRRMNDVEADSMPNQVDDQVWNDLKAHGEVERMVVEGVSGKHADMERLKGAVFADSDS
jgi:hypothetical protein